MNREKDFDIEQPPYWSVCNFQVFAKSHYQANGGCRCNEEQLTLMKREYPPGPKLAPLEYRAWVEEYGEPAGSAADGLVQQWSYFSFDAFFLEEQASEWLWEAQEAGYLPHSLAGQTRLTFAAHSLLMERVKRLLATTDSLEAVRSCLDDALADMKRLRVWEHREQDAQSNDRFSAGRLLADSVEQGRCRPWLMGWQARQVGRLLNIAQREQGRVPAPSEPSKPRGPSRKQLLAQIAQLEAENRRLRGEET
jgi:hypothetical protein